MHRLAAALRLTGAAAAILLVGAASAPAAEDFYKGKTVSLITSGTSGSYETYARLAAKHMPRFIPGTPTMIVKSMGGASGLKAANHVFNLSPRDGTEIAGVHSHIPTIAYFNAQGVQYDPMKLQWIGSATKEIFVGYMWHDSPVKSMDEALIKQAVVGGQAVGSMSVDMPILANEMLGTKFKIVNGYGGTQETRLAVQRGELNGHFGTAYASIVAETPDWLKEKKIKIIAQFGQHRSPAMLDVPLILDYAKTPGDRAALGLFLARQETGKPFFAPPDVPADRVKILRTAFSTMVKDPMFLADAKKADLEVTEPMTGEEVQAFVAEMSKTPKSNAERINEIFSKFTRGK
jgi:tripartite-type tricarboxylate transporter receptor subunit TctC